MILFFLLVSATDTRRILKVCMMIPKLNQGDEFTSHGFTRQIEFIEKDYVVVKTVKAPERKLRGRPPVSGKINLSSFLRWLPKKKKKIIQLTLF